MPAEYDAAAVPRLGVGMKLRLDPVRDAWVVLGPERLFLPDEHAVEVLKLVDGARSVGQIVDALAVRYDAPIGAIGSDVWDMLLDLAGKGAIRVCSRLTD